MKDGKNVLNFREAAEYTGLSESYLYKLTSSRKIPHSKPSGKLIYFDKSKLDAWLLSGEVKTSVDIDSAAANYVGSNPLRK